VAPDDTTLSAQPSRITALRRSGPGRVAVDLDGQPWRTVPDVVVVRCGLRADLMLDRPLARALARELRNERALGTAVRSLRARPLSEQRLRERLQSRGVRADAERAALAALSEAGYVDDERLARGRAAALADRGWGDTAIAARLVGEGLAESDVEAAVAELESEPDRARRLIKGGDRRKAWTLLQRRGFASETIEALLGDLDETDADGLG
jgi:SOS response regulatory protein OraA/RecX